MPFTTKEKIEPFWAEFSTAASGSVITPKKAASIGLIEL